MDFLTIGFILISLAWFVFAIARIWNPPFTRWIKGWVLVVFYIICGVLFSFWFLVGLMCGRMIWENGI